MPKVFLQTIHLESLEEMLLTWIQVFVFFIIKIQTCIISSAFYLAQADWKSFPLKKQKVAVVSVESGCLTL